MPTRLVLLCCGATESARSGGFAAPTEPLDDGGRRRAAALRLDGPAPRLIVTSPARAAIETAAATDQAARVEPALADVDWGAWTGLGFDAIDAARLAGWIARPELGAPGGETFDQVTARIAGWLDGLAESGDPVLAVTHPMVVRAALCAALGMPAAAALRIDIAPLATAVLSFHNVWRLQELRRN